MRSTRWLCVAAVLATALLAGATNAQESTPWRMDPGTPSAPEMAGGGEYWALVDIPGLAPGSTLGEVEVDAHGIVYVWANHRQLVPTDPGLLFKTMTQFDNDPIPWRDIPGDPGNPDVGGGPEPRTIAIATLYRYNGETWSAILRRAGETGAAIYLGAFGEVLASTNTVTGIPRIYRLTGIRWTIDPLPLFTEGAAGDIVATPWFGGMAMADMEPIPRRDVPGDPPVPDIGGGPTIFTRAGDAVLMYNGLSWVEVYRDPALASGGGELVVIDDHAILAPYDEGQMHYDGSAWHPHVAGCSNHFHCGWGARDAEGVFHMYSTGCDAEHRRVHVYEFLEGPARDLTGTMRLAFTPSGDMPPSHGSKVCGIGLDDVYVAGRRGATGFLYHFDGRAWMDLAVMKDMPPAVSVGGNPNGEVWVSLADGRLLHQAGRTPVPLDKRVAFVPEPPIELVAEEGAQLKVCASGDVAEVEFGIPEETAVQVAVFDLAGRRVATVERGNLPAGNHRRTWNAAGVPSGVYFCRLDAGAWQVTRKVAIHR